MAGNNEAREPRCFQDILKLSWWELREVIAKIQMGKTKISEKSLEAKPNLEDLELEEESLAVTQTGVTVTPEEEELLESGTTSAQEVEASK